MFEDIKNLSTKTQKLGMKKLLKSEKLAKKILSAGIKDEAKANEYIFGLYTSGELSEDELFDMFDPTENEDLDDWILMLDIIYAFAKNADASINKEPMEWAESFECFPVKTVFDRCLDLWYKSQKGNIEPKKPQAIAKK